MYMYHAYTVPHTDTGPSRESLWWAWLQVCETGWLYSLQQETPASGASQQPTLPTKYCMICVYSTCTCAYRCKHVHVHVLYIHMYMYYSPAPDCVSAIIVSDDLISHSIITCKCHHLHVHRGGIRRLYTCMFIGGCTICSIVHASTTLVLLCFMVPLFQYSSVDVG